VSPELAVTCPRRTWSRLEQLGAWGVVDQVALAGSGFLVAAAVARSGGPDALGLFALIQGVTLLVAGLLKAAFGDPLVIVGYGKTMDRLEGLAVALPVVLGHLLLGLFTAFIWLVAGDRLPHISMPTQWAALLGCLLPLASFQELARSLRLAGVGERYLCTGDILVALARVGTVAIGARYLSGLELGLAALAAGGLVSTLTIWRLLRLRGGLEQLFRLWQLGRWLVCESLLYGLTTYGIWLLVVPRAGPSVAGELRAGQQLFAPVQTILIGLNTIMLSRFARPRQHSDSSGLVLALLQAGLTGTLGILLVLLGPHATSLVFGPAFRLDRRDLILLTATLMVTAVFEVAALQLRATGHVRPLVVARALAGAVTLGGVALIGTSFAGAVASLLIGSLVGVRLTTWSPLQRRAPTDINMG
jgi:O-antigen/teichoic acid export membrane protein